ncbi:hypothetical protein BV330_05584 [Pseudomonas syringae pv. actinidiae]|nr:hypothetical protein BV339_05593 [Pseudomonas syringae pv. actinidiae]OSO23592.1 hypothetical protein BV361_00885 [Pseudomonas syringae pv. actinidiae]OSO30762.1 hypothetical protein BV359_00925 [Pseudomonas syringae pv. actinidiae]OSO66423.1 hypothetical protein BV366_00451 [Pseudomonas syringae pv. actinidiae]OSR81800.1 hypothetical protein BV330_05584 [Pseudomonas syringae pv. actinidiae]
MGIRKVHLETPDVQDLWNAMLEAGKNNPLKFTSDKILVYGSLVYRLKINFSHACVLIATRARWILFKISSPLVFQT